jgi:hypothetical protein
MKVWAWQPFMNDDVNCFTLVGSHYRGSPVIKVTDYEKETIQRGERFAFTYKYITYVAINGQVMTCEEENLKAIIANHNRKLDEFLGRNK